ncbi:MAG: hypothetical protein LBE18_08145, partial [Planctomycetaceae bacterium]|nr:hypothetical protein [Planctomycetaceae bacterium]
AAITFYPESPGAAAVGMTNVNGNYELAISHSVKGAVPGRYKVTISTKRSEQPDFSSTNANGQQNIIPARPELVPKKFTDVNTTDLIKDVKSGTQKIDFTLISDSENKTETEEK